ncbi:MAG: TRAP transporter small permease, partial [Methylobacteriaceae bacterium]|nr:TRAP transporter small permease [Methylobacteriaceae bacterium]
MSLTLTSRAGAPPFAGFGRAGRGLAAVLAIVEHVSAFVLAVDVLVVFVSVIFRYFLHEPLDWAEEVARALMVTQVFLGAATMVGRGGHAGIDAARGLFPPSWRPYLVQFSAWVIAAISVAILGSSIDLLIDSEGQTTPFGLPGWIFVYPVMAGSLLMSVLGIAVALTGPPRAVLLTLLAGAGLVLAVYAWNTILPGAALSPFALLVAGFLGSLAIGIPIAFALALSALVYFLADPSLPLSIYSQQLMAGADH